MKKIPLEETVIEAYKFFFKNIISIVGIVWLPLAIFAAALAGLVYAIVPHEWFSGQTVAATDVRAFLQTHGIQLAPAIFLLFALNLVIQAMITVGIMRRAVGEDTGLTLVWFSLGARVWRMVAATIVLFLFFFAMEIAVIAVIALANGILVASHGSTAAIVLTNIVAVIAVFVLVVFIMARLFFFLPAVVVAENKVGLGRSWKLSQGNVWRIIVLLLAVFIPVYIVTSMALYATILPPMMEQAIKVRPGDPTAALQFLSSMMRLLPALIGIELVAGLVMTGVILGSIGKAYKAVTTGDGA